MFQFQIFISQIGGVRSVTISLILLSIILLIFKKYKATFLILVSVNLSIFTTFVLKNILKVPRPTNMLIEESSYRFPSSHATVAASVATLIVYFTSLNIKKQKLRYLIYTLSLGWYLLVSYSRVYLNAHILIDVLVGGVIGLMVTVSTLKFWKK
jgi:undecaprenyl-diphosphatase